MTALHNLAVAVADWRCDPNRTVPDVMLLGHLIHGMISTGSREYAGLKIDEPEIFDAFARLSPEDRAWVRFYAEAAFDEAIKANQRMLA